LEVLFRHRDHGSGYAPERQGARSVGPPLHGAGRRGLGLHWPQPTL